MADTVSVEQENGTESVTQAERTFTQTELSVVITGVAGTISNAAIIVRKE